MKTLKSASRLIAAVFGAAFMLFALAVPVGLLSICYESGCRDTREEHWWLSIAALGFIAFSICLTSLVIAAVLFFYARHGRFRTNTMRRGQE